MANPTMPPASIGPTTAESFVADRQAYWTSFTRAATYGAGFVVLLLIGMAIFLV